MISGVRVDHESMVLDIIDEIGPGGSYLSHKHTFQNIRNQSQAIVFNRKTREQWLQASNGRDLTEMAYEKAKNILKSHKPVELSADAQGTIKDLLEEFEADG